jgi:bifunctional ADP-heptose synthase (sugar kinase/adenylyltransferase)
MTIIESSLQNEVLIILGDLLVDKTHYVKVSRLSPEAPIPIADIIETKSTPGGAGLGACYARKHNIPSILFFAISDSGSLLLEENKINYLNVCNVENNIEKIRHQDLVSGYQLLRADTDKITKPPELVISNLLDSITILSKKYTIKAVVCLDYIKGLMSEESRWRLADYCNLNNLNLYVDSKKHQANYSSASVLKFNSKELHEFMEEHGLSSKDDVCGFLETSTIIETKGGDGAEIFLLGQNYSHKTKTIHGGIPNVSGCGDVFDICFCNNFYLLNQDIIQAFENAVDSATVYAYSPIKERLQCH